MIPRWMHTDERCIRSTKSGRIKVAYRSELAALMAAEWYAQHGGGAVSPYPCHHCFRWHLTSRGLTMSTTALEEYWERRELEEQRKAERRKLRMGNGKREYGLVAGKDEKAKGKACRICGSRHGVEAHHIVHRSRIGSKHPMVHHPDNLMPVCHRHHQDHHNTAHRRIPWSSLTLAEQAFLVKHGGEAWSIRWYPR